MACILNARARSRNASRMLEKVAHEFHEGRTAIEMVVPGRGENISEIARRLVATGVTTVVAAGGDGTVSAVAAALVGTDSTLGVLPLGTLNHFAKDLGVPLEIEPAIEAIVAHHAITVDTGELNGETFINNSSLGLYPAIVQERDNRQARGSSKWVAFVKAVYTVLSRNPSFHASLDADGVSKPGVRTPFIFVGNNRYHATGARIGERTSIEGGRLWVCRAPLAGRAALVRLAFQAALGRASPADLEVLETEELWVQSKGRHLKVANDGELKTFTLPLHYRILPRSLRVIVPAAANVPDR